MELGTALPLSETLLKLVKNYTKSTHPLFAGQESHSVTFFHSFVGDDGDELLIITTATAAATLLLIVAVLIVAEEKTEEACCTITRTHLRLPVSF